MLIREEVEKPFVCGCISKKYSSSRYRYAQERNSVNTSGNIYGIFRIYIGFVYVGYRGLFKISVRI